MRILILPLVGITALSSAHAQCTQDQAVQKMKSILESPQYRAIVASAGEETEVDTKREATKQGLGQFGGRLGRAASGVMQSQDTNKEKNAAKETVSKVKSITTAMNDAGTLIEKKDYSRACRLYDIVIADMEKTEEKKPKEKKRRRWRS